MKPRPKAKTFSFSLHLVKNFYAELRKGRKFFNFNNENSDILKKQYAVQNQAKNRENVKQGPKMVDCGGLKIEIRGKGPLSPGSGSEMVNVVVQNHSVDVHKTGTNYSGCIFSFL